jgi:hypothetical protein
MINETVIKNKALGLSDGKFSVEKFENFAFALKSLSLDKRRHTIEHCMKQRDYVNLGLCVISLVVEELEGWAYDDAAGLYNSTLGGGDND